MQTVFAQQIVPLLEDPSSECQPASYPVSAELSLSLMALSLPSPPPPLVDRLAVVA